MTVVEDAAVVEDPVVKSFERTYSIGELAEVTGMSVHTLRWYESRGLFPRPVPRTSGGRRIFNQEAVRWLALLSRLRESGMPVAELAEYSRLVSAGTGNEAERIALMEAHARSLDAQIEELIACRAVIRGKIDTYCETLSAEGVGVGRVPVRRDSRNEAR
jgi:DNA-binding transcriptional MerR regulator